MKGSVGRMVVGLGLAAAGFGAILLQERVPVGELLDSGPVVLSAPLGASEVAALAKDMAGADAGRARAAAQRLEAAGPAGIEALDALIAALDAQDGVLRLRAAKAIGALGRAANRAVPAVGRLVLDANQTQRDAALEALRRLEPDAEQSRPLYEIAIARKEPLGWQSGDLMAALHAPTVVPRLLAALNGPDDEAAADAIHLIGRFEQRSAPACAALVGALDGDRPRAAAAAGYALGRCCRDDAAIDALIAGLKGKPVEVRRGCILGLGKMAAAASRARDALQKSAMNENDAWNASYAVQSYIAVGGERLVAAKMLGRRLSASRSDGDWIFAAELGRLGVASAEVRDALHDAAGRSGEMMRRSARDSLEMLTRARPD